MNFRALNLRTSHSHLSQKKPEKPKWTEEQIESALKIQKAYRDYKQRKIEAEARKKKEEMDRLIEEVV